MTDSLKKKVLSGLAWRSMERFGTQAMGAVVTILLARLLEPKDFGTITLIIVFITLAEVFVNGGFGAALVQKKEVTEGDYNSIFYLSLAVAVVLYSALFVSSPWIAKFYNEPILVWVLRLLSLTLIVGALNSIQTAVLTREMKFKVSFKASLLATLVSGVVGVGMAYNGYGVWALVGSTMAAQVASIVVLWRMVAWRPRIMFSFAAIRQMFGFSSKLLVSGLLDALFNNIYNVIIGKLFNPTILGYYSQGQRIPNIAMSCVQGTISSVMFPAMASCQHDKIRVKAIMRRMIKSTCFLVFPMMIGLAAVAKPLVLVLLTDKWVPCVPFLQLSCIIFAFWPLHVANLQVIKALGRSDIILTLEIIKKSLVLVTILLTYRYGVMAMVIGQAIMGPIGVAINAYPNRQLINYSLQQQTLDTLPALLLATGMGALVLAMEWVIPNVYFLLASQCVLGATVYFAGAKLLKFESADYLWRTACQHLLSKLKYVARVNDYGHYRRKTNQ
jgi:O-antigen/teichoic acid export membrane protein